MTSVPQQNGCLRHDLCMNVNTHTYICIRIQGYDLFIVIRQSGWNKWKPVLEDTLTVSELKLMHVIYEASSDKERWFWWSYLSEFLPYLSSMTLINPLLHWGNKKLSWKTHTASYYKYFKAWPDENISLDMYMLLIATTQRNDIACVHTVTYTQKSICSF